ncbi:MAG: GGDEF domain-containing protein [Candidatus Abyssobacteria bacterium SURF_5]|uniref:diguanylate cyclase n=1 Tax=Abyssobacteria bacterium (strain SURF_5) TaxID=2093360 RepID=A0A3A4NPY0_ABYX5|nr:MAG: GGDEF domain-containing protein [Candidatus Abyssubacteria bacterium SURF_5]
MQEGSFEGCEMDDRDTVRIDFGTGEFGSSEKAGLLQVIRGADIGSEYEVKPGNNIIGRQKDANIRINNKSISRRHAQIVCKPEDPPEKRYTLYDLQSTNGTRINGHPIECAPLRDGDRVQFGSVVCKFMEIDALERSYLRELKKMIEYDKQTELLQLKPFYQKLEPALADAESNGRSLSILMMDLDGLKKINDIHGHLVGTHYIIEIARIVHEELSPFGVAALYGGDEFIGYLPNSDKASAQETAERLRMRVDDFRFPEKEIQQRVTISIGIAEYPSDALEMMPLVANADKALYVAKGRGKNCVVAYDPSMADSGRKP